MAIEKNNEEKMPKEILPEEVELQAQDLNPSGDVDIQMLQDGGAIVDFDPQAGAMQGAEIHTANLAEFLDEDDLTMLASEVLRRQVRTVSRRIRCNTPCSCRSCYTVSSTSLQRTYACQWSC